MIRIRNLNKTYSSKNGLVKVLDDISIDFPENGMVFLLGKSGCGKSTLLHILGGLDSPSSGILEIDGRDASSFSPADLGAYRASEVGFVFQDANLIPDLDVGGNVSLSLELLGAKSNQESIEGVLGQVGLEGFSKRRTKDLSGGQKQRVAIARALAKEPRIIIADEPTGSLDGETGEGIFKLLKRLSEERLVIVASHDIDSAKRFADRIIELKDGGIMKDVLSSEAKPVIGRVTASPIEPRLPLRTSLKIAFSGLKKRRFRLIISMILAGLSFSLFGSLLSFSIADKNEIIYEGITNSDFPAISAEKVINGVKRERVFFDAYGEESYKYVIEESGSESGYFSQKELEGLNSKGADCAGVFSLKNSHKRSFEGDMVVDISLCRYYGNYANVFDGFSDCGADFCSKHFELLMGRYPESVDEIAISSFKADAMLHSTNWDGEKLFDSLDDVLGASITLNSNLDEKLGKVTISGIYKMDDVPSKFDALKTPGASNDPSLSRLEQQYYDYKRNSLLNVAFVTDSFYDTYIGEYGQNRESMGSLKSKGSKGVYAIVEDPMTGDFEKGDAYDFYNVIPTSFASEHLDEYSILGIDGKPFDKVDLADGEIIVSEDYRRFVSNDKYRALLKDISSLTPNKFTNQIKNLRFSREAYDLFTSDDIAEKTDILTRAVSNGKNIENSDKVLSAYQTLENAVATWYPELEKRSHLVEANLRYGYNSKGLAKNRISDTLIRHYLSESEQTEFKALSSKFSKYDFSPNYIALEEGDWATLETWAERFYDRIFATSYALEDYSMLMPASDAEEALADSPNKEAALAIAVSFNQRFGTYERLLEAFYDGELSEDDLDDLVATFVLKSTSELELGYYQYGHFRGRSAYATKIDFMIADSAKIYKTVGSISSHGDMLKNTIVANPKTLEELGLIIDGRSYFEISSSDSRFRGESKYFEVVSFSAKRRAVINMLNRSYSGYRYETAGALGSDLKIYFADFERSSVIYLSVAIVFGLLSALLQASFIGHSIRDKEKEIGILRAMGVDAKDVFKTFSIESGIIAIVAAVFGNVICALALTGLNDVFGIHNNYSLQIHRYNFMVALLITFLAIGISFLASYRPIKKICKKEVVDAIRNAE